MNDIKILKPLDPCKIREKEIFGFDVETIRKKDNKFLMGSIVGKDFQYISWNIEKFSKKILSRKFKNKFLFATNLQFDFFSCFFPDEIFDSEKFSYLLPEKSSNFIFIKYVPYKITFLDTINYFPASVKKMGEKINHLKLNFPSCLEKMNDIKDLCHVDEIKEIERYNVRDSEITYKFMCWFQKVTNEMGGNMRNTIASSAMDLFQRKYLKKPIFQPSKNLLSKMYKGYYGGRTETIFHGYSDEKFNYYDINSSYPNVMQLSYPDLNTIKLKNKGNINIIDMYEGMSRVHMKIDYMKIPYLPFRHESKLLFPIGDFEGYYSHFEIRNAVDMGYEILDIKDSIYFTDSNYFLKDYSYDMVKKREIDVTNSLIYKLFGNSLYGKFGQKYNMDKIVISCLDDFDFTDQENIELIKNSKVFLNNFFLYISKKNRNYPSFILPIWALYTTAYARHDLYQKFISNNKGKICYFDTDSCITDKEIEVKKGIGGIKKEHVIKELILVKPKQYLFRNSNDKYKITFKGIPRRELNYNKFIKILDNNMKEDKQKFEYKKIVKFKEGLKRNIKVNSEIVIQKQFDLNDNKRIWKNDFSLDYFEESQPIKIKNDKIQM